MYPLMKLSVTKLFALFALSTALVLAQNNGAIKGSVQDESGAVIPGAKIAANGPRAILKTAIAGPDGSYTFAGLPDGSYTVQATAPGLTQFLPLKVEVGATPTTLNIQLRVAVESQQVTVQETTAPAVTTDPAQNAGQIVLKAEDLQALSDDPDDLASDLQALAGPSAGPNGGQIYIDGFTGGRLASQGVDPRSPDQLESVLGGVRPAGFRPHRDLHQAGHRQVPRAGVLQHQRRDRGIRATLI